MKKNTVIKKKSTLSRRAFLGGVGTAAMGLPVAALASQSSQVPSSATVLAAGGKCPEGFVRLLVKKPAIGQKIAVYYVDSKYYELPPATVIAKIRQL